MEDCNRVGKLAVLVKRTIIRDNFTSREKDCLAAKTNLFLCATAATKQEVVDTVHAFDRQRKEWVALVIESSRAPQLLPGASVPTGDMSALLNAAKHGAVGGEGLTERPTATKRYVHATPRLCPTDRAMCSKDTVQS